MEVEDQRAGQENTMYSYAKLGNPSESKTELEKTRNQLNMKMECCDKMEYFPELQGLQDEGKAGKQAVCKKMQACGAQNRQNEYTKKKLEAGETQTEEFRRMREQVLRKHAEWEEKVNMLQRETVKEGQKEDVPMGKRAGQTSENVGFGEALKKLRIKHVQGLLSSDEITWWMCEARSKVQAVSTTSGLTSEAS